ncbi:PspC domain-containing protein [Bifidobacterium callimiconis]|uniref:PspC domain-containing protein n=1 Tax=Bifidobacterium callimiconis TaxID=2306973 RepID=UPI001BDC5B10|nr:PspC domain-containing protein [Bifidobacterium callimiconis]MBT1177343.1 PspC domain-containing protein [Bifidobacterium callimiconis]
MNDNDKTSRGTTAHDTIVHDQTAFDGTTASAGTATHGDPGFTHGAIPPDTPRTAPPVTSTQAKESRFFRWVRASAVERSPYRWFGGVCGGIAYRIGVSELLVRAIFVASCCFFGVGAAVYGLAWLILPDSRDGHILLQSLGHGKLSWPLAGASLMFWAGFIAMVNLPATMTDGRVDTVGWWMFVFVTIGFFAFLNWSGSHAQYVVRPSSAVCPVHSLEDEMRSAQDGGTETSTDVPSAGSPAKTPDGAVAAVAAADKGGDKDGTAMQTATTPSNPVATPSIVHSKPRLRRRPAGFLVVGVVCGLMLVSLAGVLLMNAITQAGPQEMIRSILIWVCASAAVVGIVLVVLGFLGRKSGGLLPIAVLLFIAVAILAMTGVTYAGTSSADESRNYMVKNVYSNLELGSGDDQMRMYRNGLTLNGEQSGGFSHATINLSDVTECPTGTIHLNVEYTQLVVRMPRGCGFLLGNDAMGYPMAVSGLRGLSSNSPLLSRFTFMADGDLSSGQLPAAMAPSTDSDTGSADNSGAVDGTSSSDSTNSQDSGDGSDAANSDDASENGTSDGSDIDSDEDSYDYSTNWTTDDTKLLRIDATIRFASVDVSAFDNH